MSSCSSTRYRRSPSPHRTFRARSTSLRARRTSARHAGSRIRETEVVVYCMNPTCYSSVAVANRLVELGYRNVRHYPGGKEDWKEAGLPLEGGRA